MAALIHYGYAFFSLSAMSRMELNFFFAITEYFAVGWGLGVIAVVVGQAGMGMAIAQVHRDGVRRGEIREKSDPGRNRLMQKMKETKKREAERRRNDNRNADDAEGRVWII